jgi:16S rRNA (guanine966-N2)-methyltransferase
MRIIAGKYKGRKLKKPPDEVRPTKDSLRETIFNILKETVADSVVLDLFSGSGALAIEALSRGAESITIVDKKITIIRKNLEALSIKADEKVKLFKADALFFIKKAGREARKYSLIFIDPPYHKNMAKKCLQRIAEYDILQANGLIVVEHSLKDQLPQVVGALKVIRTVKSGQTSVSFIKR